MQLTFYLFDRSVKDYDNALDLKKTSGSDGFKEIKLSNNVPFQARAYFQRNKASVPKWLSFIAPYCSLKNQNEIQNTLNSFLLLLKVKKRIFAITTGFGFTAIRREKLERDFGLKVTLNAIDPDKIKNIDVRNIDLITRQRRTLLNHESPVGEFDLNVDEDVVSLMGGVPLDVKFGKRVFGSDSLSLTADVEFEKLASKCEDALKFYGKRTYKKAFDFIDQVKPIKDKALISVLDAKLKKAVDERKSDKFTVAYPEMEWQQIEKFKIFYGAKKVEVEEVTLQTVFDFLVSNSITDVDLARLRVVGLDGGDNAVTRRSEFHDYAVFETYHKSRAFILSLNKWYAVEKDYLKQVDDSIKGITDVDYRGFLPTIKRGEHEDAYNRNAAKAMAYTCLDRKNFIVPDGRSKVEVCDLFTPGRDMICVKRETKSATLSHLFSQGSVSATLFNDYSQYREYLHKQLPTPKPFDPAKPDNRDFRIVYAITTDSAKSLVDTLPFFSKINLRNHRRTIERLGFALALCKIPYA
ncbi:MAG TPA: DUF6119 family protein [Pyrinomonadaceae bacterium]|nr:DUF6119 family protein [Pyrinomonadaceae bacterium]